MPITLEKLFSPTAPSSFPFLGEIVHVTWAPFRWTGEMQELAERLSDESAVEKAAIAALKEEAEAIEAEAVALVVEVDLPKALDLRARASALTDEAMTRELRLDTQDKTNMRDFLVTLLVTWDVLDDAGKPLPTDKATLRTLPTPFLQAVFTSLSMESQPDPQKAPESVEPSNTEKISAPSPTGTPSSSKPARSVSRRSNSTNGHTAPATTLHGAPGR